MIRVIERVEPRRVAGAVCFRDAETKLPVTRPLEVEVVAPTEKVRMIRNASGRYVIMAAPGLEAWTESFEEPPGSPPAHWLSIELVVGDPMRRFLPRRVVVTVPPDKTQPSELFAPVSVDLYPSPCARPAPGSALVRLSIQDAEELPMSGVLVSLSIELEASVTLVARGLSDERGEAVVLVPGIPAVRWADESGGDPFHPAFAAQISIAHDPDTPWPPNPDLLAAELATVPETLEITSGHAIHHILTLGGANP